MTDENKMDGPGEEKKPMSPLEKIRAAAAAKKAEGGESAAGEPKTPSAGAAGDAGSSKPMSPLDKIRAAAAQKAAGGEASVPTPKGDSPAAKKAEVKEKPAAPPIAKKPPVKPKTAEPAASPSRRFFLLTWLGAAWAFFSGGCAAAVIAGVRFLYPNVLQEPPTVFKIGAPDKFEEGNVYETWKNEFGVWIVKSDGKLYALRTVCTHLGCTPNWLEAEQKFKCPCHGSGFRKTGINFEGPAPRPLERFAILIADDGQVMIDKSKKLQQELGQWTPENNAFLSV